MRHLPLVDLLVDTKTELLELALRGQGQTPALIEKPPFHRFGILASPQLATRSAVSLLTDEKNDSITALS